MTFEDVFVELSHKEWDLLDTLQRNMYIDVMLEDIHCFIFWQKS